MRFMARGAWEDSGAAPVWLPGMHGSAGRLHDKSHMSQASHWSPHKHTCGNRRQLQVQIAPWIFLHGHTRSSPTPTCRYRESVSPMGASLSSPCGSRHVRRSSMTHTSSPSVPSRPPAAPAKRTMGQRVRAGGERSSQGRTRTSSPRVPSRPLAGQCPQYS